jgi:acyl-CoA thioester hydrolase
MSRIKIDLPAVFPFTTDIAVRITDLNYGGHVGNDTVLSIIHEARVRFLVSKGFSELNVDGAGLIMSDVAIQFKNELFYGDIIRISIAVGDFTKVSFEMYYLLETLSESKGKTVAIAKTGMLCYDYTRKKITAVPESFKQACVS